ncbi:hypothetical protein Val02_42780 [Virgisporangium aliadipatigenens]|uniref:Uncharacterized protein n=1 Tax=Virgisporangium aliadipatigenens TaxID=741659 RepID=A0A8J3YN48_9ACTN|nr:hypothetical protein [Virgisporangium aliadipatigenens]GIJ47392.1 hypothetical protein Val02_42780 [Virgisporangium aliadipatigenens]
MPVSGQLNLFGVEARPPSAFDLEGLLAGAGQVVRLGGTARVSVVVDAAWRVRVLAAEFSSRELATSWKPVPVTPATDEPPDPEPTPAGAPYLVRTAYSSVLAPLAGRWLKGADKRTPRGLTLDGRKLRLWLVAGGAPDDQGGFTLELGPGDEAEHEPVGEALKGLGLTPVLLGSRAGAPAYRIVGRRRLSRLAELVGEPPKDSPPGGWPLIK